MMMRVILAALLAACAPQGLLELEPPPTAAYDERSACSDAPPQSPICIVNAPDIDETAARAALNDEEFAIQRDGDQLTFFARVAAENADLCCSLQGPMTRIGETDLFVVRYRLSRLDDAALTFFPPSWLVSGRSFRREDAYRWFGPNAAQPPPVGDLADVEVRVSKSQIGFYRRHSFASVWIPNRYLSSEHPPLVLSVF